MPIGSVLWGWQSVRTGWKRQPAGHKKEEKSTPVGVGYGRPWIDQWRSAPTSGSVGGEGEGAEGAGVTLGMNKVLTQIAYRRPCSSCVGVLGSYPNVFFTSVCCRLTEKYDRLWSCRTMASVVLTHMGTEGMLPAPQQVIQSLEPFLLW